MKITVINKAKSIRKPQNFCPWVVDDDQAPSKQTTK
jgi:hypothetical protein